MVMRFAPKEPPRRFSVGNAAKFDMKDCGELMLSADEQVTLKTERGGEYDVARKDWGFYATPSLNGRLEQFGLRTVLIRNRETGRYFVLLVERGEEPRFDAYMARERLDVIAWMDSTAALDALARRLSSEKK
jgi:hypothetical protein